MEDGKISITKIAFMYSVTMARWVSDLFSSDLWLPQCAEDHVCTLYLLGIRPLALQPAQSVFWAHTVSLCYPCNCLKKENDWRQACRITAAVFLNFQSKFQIIYMALAPPSDVRILTPNCYLILENIRFGDKKILLKYICKQHYIDLLYYYCSMMNTIIKTEQSKLVYVFWWNNTHYYLLIRYNGDPDFMDHICPSSLQKHCCIHHTYLFTCKLKKSNILRRENIVSYIQ